MVDEHSVRETAVELRRALSNLNRRLRSERTGVQMAPGKLSVLGRLHHDGPASPGALAMAQGIQPQSLTRLLAELEEEGLVSRQTDHHDRRQHVIAITAMGRKALHAVAGEYVAWLADAISTQFSPIERDLLWIAVRLLNRLAAAEGGAIGGC